MDVAPGSQEKYEKDGGDGIYQWSIDVQRANITLNLIDQEASIFYHSVVPISAYFAAEIKVDLAHFIQIHVGNNNALSKEYEKLAYNL